MPTFIVPGQTTSILGGGGDCCCPSTTRFFQNITDKLLKMTQSLQTQFDKLKADASCAVKARGTILASIEAPTMKLGVKREFIEYIRRYGPPENGKFNKHKLRELREEFGLIDYDSDGSSDSDSSSDSDD